MPTGTITWTPPGNVQLAIPATPISVYLYDSTEEGDDAYTLLPNIRCEQIQYKEGSEPPSARFSYILDSIVGASNGWPDSFEEIWPLVGVTLSAYTVATDDEIVVLASMADGSTRVLFHGFARVPQCDVSPAAQAVTFVAVGVAIRCWDKPIGSRPQRDASDPFAGDVTNVDLPWRFNPAGDGPDSIGGIVPNCTPDGYDVGGGEDGEPASDTPYPVFLDPIANTNAPNLESGGGDSGAPVLWDLSRATRAILGIYNIQATDSLVGQPAFDDLETILQNRQPLPGAEFFDPDDPSTYTTEDNTLRDYDATNKAWPEVLSELFEFYGFAMRWVTRISLDGTPTDTFEVYRKDAGNAIAPKSVYLPGLGTSVASGRNVNVSEFHGAFDFHGVANQIHLDTHPVRYEASFILAPAFTPTSGDGMAANRTQFLASNLDTATQGVRDKYRLWVIDELGEGFYAYDNPEPALTTEQPFSFDEIMPPKKDGSPIYAYRRRKPDGTLLSKDYLNKPYRAQLAISRNYGSENGGQPDGYSPCVYDADGFSESPIAWQTIDPGTWSLLPDRIGVRITAPDVEEWNVGKPPAGMATGADGSMTLWPASTGKLRGITAMSDPIAYADPPAAGDYTVEPYWLRLTVVFDSDQDLHIKAARRDASPLANIVRRRVDCRDHFSKEVVHTSSPFNVPDDGNLAENIVIRDDTTAAQAFADQMRAAHEMPPLTASVTIPVFTTYIKVGDRISEIDGRDVSLQTNAAGEQQEAPNYPFVVAVTWSFEGGRQSTTLQLSDRRHEPRGPVG